MIQESLIDYINSQMKLGASHDAIKATLTGVGWTVADVEDTLKKIEAEKTVQPMAVEPVVVSRVITPVGTASPASATSSGPQIIKVSDLISSSASSAPVMPAGKSATPAQVNFAAQKPAMTVPTSRSPMTGSGPVAAKPAAAMPVVSKTAIGKPHGSSWALITEILLVIIVIAVGAFAGFLYMQNKSLSAQLGSLNGQSTGVNSQLSALQAQMSASTTALTAQVATLTAETQELQTELAFYDAPSSTTLGATSSIAVSGVVSGGGKIPYVITATYGAKLYIANSKVASVIAALAPLEGTATTTAATAQFSGTYVPGSDSITLMAVNGTALQ